jgi:hypothetical protein
MLHMKPLPVEHNGSKAGNDVPMPVQLSSPACTAVSVPHLSRPKRASAARLLEPLPMLASLMRLQGEGAVSLLEPSVLEGTLARHTRVFTAWSKAVMCTGHTAMSDPYFATATQRLTIVTATPVRGAIGQPERTRRGLWRGSVSQGLHTRMIPVSTPMPCACSAWPGSCATGLLRFLAEGVKGDAWRHPSVC